MLNLNPFFVRTWFHTMVTLLLFTVACNPVKPSPTILPTQIPSSTDTPIPTETPFPVWVNIDIRLDEIQQTIEHVGSGNFIHYFGGTTSSIG
jgi:hypothetical protein